jgi:1-hydroxycarotenoid 3,4-desaturase
MFSTDSMPLPPSPRVLVIGAGIGGLTAAALLAQQGMSVQLLERAAAPGGKMRQVAAGAQWLDGGPTVLTMRWVFDELFERLGLGLDDHVQLRRCEVLARHSWGHHAPFDLLADFDASMEAIAAFSSGDEALRYRAFCRRAADIYKTLETPFLRSARPTPWSLMARVGWRGLPGLARIGPFNTMWGELGRYFHDPRLRQLFGRYATYCGSSPFDAPATLMLVAHVERDGVWQVEGGMVRLAQALAAAAAQQGARLRYGQHVTRVLLKNGRVSGVETALGEQIDADVVLFNGDVAALRHGAMGTEVQQALGGRPPDEKSRAGRSLSALTWHCQAEASGFALSHHNVFFSDPGNEGYRREFDAIEAGRLPADPTVYVCAQDRSASLAAGYKKTATERLMCLVNAPAQADDAPLNSKEIDSCQTQMFAQLARSGLTLRVLTPSLTRTTPQDFAALFPATGGALYGAAARGWQSSFQRPGSSTRLRGLYLAGGSVHPGPGVPMAALSGQLAAAQIGLALRSTHRSVPVAMPGGMSMR